MPFSFPKTPFKKIKNAFLQNALKKTHENREKIHEKHDKLFKTHRVQDVKILDLMWFRKNTLKKTLTNHDTNMKKCDLMYKSH